MKDWSKNEGNFMFAFNNYDFSDRIIHLEIIPDDDNSIVDPNKLEGEKYIEWFSCIQASQSKDSESCDNEKVQTLHIEPSKGAQLKTLHINSIILAAKSPFFYELFTSDMRESQQKNDVTFTIKQSEEATLMDLLHFMYGNTLRATSSSDLVDVLIASYKLKVTSCTRYCIQMLLKVPISLESALLYLELSSSVLTNEVVKPLTDVAKQFVIARYKDFTKSQDEVMDLPLFAIEVILGGSGLQVISEDNVFNFILRWTRKIYPDLGGRKEIIANHLAPFICFSNLSCSKLKEFLDCPDFGHEKVSKLALKALCSKVELGCGQHINVDSKNIVPVHYGTSERVYWPHCVVYFNLTKNEMKSLFTSIRLQSQTFYLGEKQLYLLACCKQDNHEFGLFVCKTPQVSCTVDFEFAVMRRSSMEFQSKFKVNNSNLNTGVFDLLGIPWTELMSDSCDYFINGVLHLRAELTLNKANA